MLLLHSLKKNHQICEVIKLNFPEYKFKFKSSENNRYIFDVIRKKYVILQPEEWVRQHCIMYLIHEKNYPKSLINIEKKITINGLSKRYDIVVFDSTGKVNILVECKAPTINISQNTFDQIARYNMALKANYLKITNGINHYFCTMNYACKAYNFIKELPDYRSQ